MVVPRLQSQDSDGQLRFPQDDGKRQILSLTNTIHIAKNLGNLAKFENKRYDSGEYYCVIQEPIETAFIIGNITAANQMEFLSMIDGVIRAGAKKIILIIPYFAYARQDKMEAPYSSIGFEIMAKMINSYSIDKIITIDIHSPELLDLFDCEVVNIASSVILSPFSNKGRQDLVCVNEELDRALLLQSQVPDAQILFPQDDEIIITPDQGSYNHNRDLKPICLNKKRIGNSMEFHMNESIKGKNCFLIDDIIDSGNTMKSAIDFLYQNGAGKVKAYATHILGRNIPKEVIFTTDSLGARDDIQTINLADILRKYL